MDPWSKTYKIGKRPFTKVHAGRVCTFLFISCLLLGIVAFPTYGQDAGLPILPGDTATIQDPLPPDASEETQQALEDLIKLKDDIENGIGKKPEKAASIINEGLSEREGLTITKKDENGLPLELSQPDGAIVEYSYEFSREGKVDSVTISSRRVEVKITKHEITITYHPPEEPEDADADSDSPPPVVTVETGENAFDTSTLVRYGMINFKAMEEAFNELEEAKEDLKEKYSKDKNLNIDNGNTLDNKELKRYREEMKMVLNDFYKKISGALEESGFSSFKIKKGLDTVLDAVIMLPEKKR